MARLRSTLALACVLAGSVALAYPALAYATNAQRGRHLTESVEAVLGAPNTPTAAEAPREASGTDAAVARPGDGTKSASPDRGKPVLDVPAPHDGQALGVIQIPAIGLRTVVLQGTADSTLLTGPGHLPWTSMPGTGGISVLAAHRDLQFADLHEVRSGDRIWLQLPSGALGYRVRQRAGDEPRRHEHLCRVARSPDRAATPDVLASVLRRTCTRQVGRIRSSVEGRHRGGAPGTGRFDDERQHRTGRGIDASACVFGLRYAKCTIVARDGVAAPLRSLRRRPRVARRHRGGAGEPAPGLVLFVPLGRRRIECHRPNRAGRLILRGLPGWPRRRARGRRSNEPGAVSPGRR
jgi:LPXTG-site transpeptidase (sortase) family protein